MKIYPLINFYNYNKQINHVDYRKNSPSLIDYKASLNNSLNILGNYNKALLNFKGASKVVLAMDKEGSIKPYDSRSIASQSCQVSRTTVTTSTKGSVKLSNGFTFFDPDAIMGDTPESTDIAKLEDIWKNTHGNKIISILTPNGKIRDFDSLDDIEKKENIDKSVVSNAFQGVYRDRVITIPYLCAFFKASELYTFDKSGKKVTDIKQLEKLYKESLGYKRVVSIDKDLNIETFDSQMEALKAHNLKSRSEISSAISKEKIAKGRIYAREKDLIYFDKEGNKKIDPLKLEKFYNRTLGQKRIGCVNAIGKVSFFDSQKIASDCLDISPSRLAISISKRRPIDGIYYFREADILKITPDCKKAYDYGFLKDLINETYNP